MFCPLVVLVKLSLLAKWMARKTPLRKPNRGEGIISIKPRPKSAHDFLGLLYCFIVLLCIYVVSCPYVIYYPTVMARYSPFVLKVPLNPKQTNKQCCCAVIYVVAVRRCATSPFLSSTSCTVLSHRPASPSSYCEVAKHRLLSHWIRSVLPRFAGCVLFTAGFVSLYVLITIIVLGYLWQWRR